ncbi:hypothetical protein [uncultured Brachyspira sp.]|uniref:hypothetical protein n=1 Tax=uncultured Brachyspira sp. TaxID=221953 RepID=UPI0025F820A9|nr:hypothetical protein [uncultured Brachyspira sp.]
MNIYYSQTASQKKNDLENNHYLKKAIERLEKAILNTPNIIFIKEIQIKDLKIPLFYRSCPSFIPDYVICMYFIVLNDQIHIKDITHSKTSK